MSSGVLSFDLELNTAWFLGVFFLFLYHAILKRAMSFSEWNFCAIEIIQCEWSIEGV